MKKSGKRTYVDHYTCNAPSKKILEQYRFEGIIAVGEEYKGDQRAYIRIPIDLLKKRGLYSPDLTALYINCEKLIRDLEEKSQKKKK